MLQEQFEQAYINKKRKQKAAEAANQLFRLILAAMIALFMAYIQTNFS